jgi:hypothetical protein
MTFKELTPGQRFRLVSFPKNEWIKTYPVSSDPAKQRSRYNAHTVDLTRRDQIGHSAKVIVPPYGDTTGAKRQKQRYAAYKARCLSAGWDSIAQMETAIINGLVEAPAKPA